MASRSVLLFFSLCFITLAVCACGPTSQDLPDADQPDAANDTDSPVDAAIALTPTADVSHPRELRALWVATVSNLDFPSRTGLTEMQARAEITTIVDGAAARGFNAVFFQVRPESDALYDSSLEPWSRFASGTQGVAPAYDPLALFLELSHARGLELHAWMNPYRALANTTAKAASDHVTKLFPAAAVTYGGAVTMNPADIAVRAHILDVVADLTSRYDIDGIVFDDYFYPYPGSTPFPDDNSYQAYQLSGGSLSKKDWRRDNVNRLVSSVLPLIHSMKSWMRFGIAPFGIYRPGTPAGVTGLDAYDEIACDSLKWITSGWVDYLAPQLYWPSTSTGQPFGPLVTWWASQVTAPRGLYPSLALYRLGETSAWTPTELETQVTLTRAQGSTAAGQTWFRAGSLLDDKMGMSASFSALYAAPARPPIVPTQVGVVVEPPTVVLDSTGVTISHVAADTLSGYAAYRDDGTRFVFVRFVPRAVGNITLDSGRWALSAIDRGGAESKGAILVVP